MSSDSSETDNSGEIDSGEKQTEGRLKRWSRAIINAPLPDLDNKTVAAKGVVDAIKHLHFLRSPRHMMPPRFRKTKEKKLDSEDPTAS